MISNDIYIVDLSTLD